MTNSTLNVTQALDTAEKFVKLIDQGDGTYAIQTASGLGVPTHDYIGLTYTGSNLTSVVFKTGGSGGTTVATLTLAYTGSTLDSVTKT
jgi:hypothetical protein